ncbi:MAG: flagellar hook-basal body complex protein FliE [Acidimicrobiales bacterium]
MTVPIPPASSAGSALTTTLRDSDSAQPNVAVPTPPPTAAVESPTTIEGFAKVVNDALDTVSQLEYGADSASQQAATGDLSSVSDFMVATSDAQLATEMTVAIRDKALAAFNDILTMQI